MHHERVTLRIRARLKENDAESVAMIVGAAYEERKKHGLRRSIVDHAQTQRLNRHFSTVRVSTSAGCIALRAFYVLSSLRRRHTLQSTLEDHDRFWNATVETTFPLCPPNVKVR
jgi:hypothetical protein